MKTLEVYKIGQGAVYLGEIKVWIHKICLDTNDSVSYEIVWFDGRDRKSTWAVACELSPLGSSLETRKIGFRSE